MARRKAQTYGSCLLAETRWRMSARQLAEAFAVVAAIHVGVNVAGYLLGARTSPL